MSRELMGSNRHKFSRFVPWRSLSSEFSLDDAIYPGRSRSFLRRIWDCIQTGSERFMRTRLSSQSADDHKIKKQLEPGSRNQVLDPQGPFLHFWNKIFEYSCVLAAALDSLFFYIPMIDSTAKCLTLDEPLQTTACVLRSLIDVFYVLHIIFQFRTGFIAPPSRIFGRGELVDDAWLIAQRYLSTYFIIDILSVLPLPQLVILVVVPATKGHVSMVTKNLLAYVIYVQYVPRLLRIFPLHEQVTGTSGLLRFLTETAWAGAAFNLVLYLLAAHIVGSTWYLLSIEREVNCWVDACKGKNCDNGHLFCESFSLVTQKLLNGTCFHRKDDDDDNPNFFHFGIFIGALKSKIMEKNNFRRKFFYCFWWGLRGVSSLGQNLETSTDTGEILFVVFISILGLILFSSLIGNMQKYLQSLTVKVEEMRVKRRDAEHWMSHRMLPEYLKKRIRRYEQYKWQETRGVQEEELIGNLPKDLKREIKRHLCLNFLMKVRMFKDMDNQLLDAMCDHIKPVLYTENSTIIREGEPVDLMLFIIRGSIVATTSDSGKPGFSEPAYLKDGDFCGEELLTWALDIHSSPTLPNSTRTVNTLTEVEAFALMAQDCKSVSTQYRQRHKQLQKFRFYSFQWRAWAVHIIQTAWHRYQKRKLNRYLMGVQVRLNDMENRVDSSANLKAAAYSSKLSPRPPPLPPQKPTDPAA